MIYFDHVPLPLGDLLIAASDDGLTALYFEEKRWAPTRTDAWSHVNGGDSAAADIVHATHAQLDEYFAGDRKTFDVPLAAAGTPFQQSVWAALRTIPFGVTRGYAQLATQLGLTNAARAVGAANGKNPISIIVPCHRVIGADGSLVGFGGGIERKHWLLRHEGALLL